MSPSSNENTNNSSSSASSVTSASTDNSSVDIKDHINVGGNGEDACNGADVEAEYNLARRRAFAGSQSSLAAALESNCWINMINDRNSKAQEETKDNMNGSNNNNGKSAGNSNLQQAYSSVTKNGARKRKKSASDLASAGMDKGRAAAGCLARAAGKLVSVVKWVVHDFTLKHLVWIKLIFLFQSASMTVLYPYLNLHMKSLGLTVPEAAAINAVVPVLFIFTPPIAGFLADRLGNFRFLLSLLTALGGMVALLLLVIPPGRDMSPYPENLNWGISCGKPNNRARFQKLMLHGFRQDECDLKSGAQPFNVSFTPGTCGYLCPTRTRVEAMPHFYEYRVIWPNRGGGFGISEIVDIVTLDSEEARLYHEPGLVDDNIFFPMNWTFHLSCDRIRPNDCIFNPIRRAPSQATYQIQAVPTRETSVRANSGAGSDDDSSGRGPQFDVESITPPETGRPVGVPVNCGAKEVVAQVISTVRTDSLPPNSAAREVETDTVDTRFSGCTLHCLVNVPRKEVCVNGETGVTHNPAVTFWCYLLARTALGVLTAASLMMFEGAVMATIQELGGDYGIQRFVGNFGAIVFAPLGGYLIDATSDPDEDNKRANFAAAVYIYLGLKLAAAAMILCVRLDFRPPGERILKNLKLVLKNVEVVVFLVQMMFAGAFWGFIEAFLFWFLDDLGANKLLMGWTVAIGMLTSLPFLVFSGPITDLLGHINVIVLGMVAYAIRMVGYSFLEDPVYVYPYEALEGFTMALMMTSAVTYVARISGPKTIASVMGLMGALFFGVGKGSGALFGGALMSFIGARNTFRYFACNALLCALLYLVFQCAYVRPRRRTADVNSEEEEQDEKEGTDNKAYEDVVPREMSSPKTSGESLNGVGQQPPPLPKPSSTPPNQQENKPQLPPKMNNGINGNGVGDVESGSGTLSPSNSSSGPRSLTGGTRV